MLRFCAGSRERGASGCSSGSTRPVGRRPQVGATPPPAAPPGRPAPRAGALPAARAPAAPRGGRAGRARHAAAAAHPPSPLTERDSSLVGDDDALEHDALRPRVGEVVVERRLDLRALREGASGCVVEVLAEVLRREVRERAEPHRDPRHAGTALGVGDREDLRHQVVQQRLLVHRPYSSSSASTDCGDAVERRRHLRRDRVAHPERRAFDADHEDAARRPPERPPELEGVRDGERVRRGEPEVAGQRPVAGVDPVDGARGGARRHRVHDHDQVEARPRRRAASSARRRTRARSHRRRAAGRRRAGPPRRHRGSGSRGRRLLSRALDLEPEEVRRAGDARVVVADRLLAAMRELVVREVQRLLDDADEILLDRLLVLRGRRHDLRVEDRPCVVDLVAVPADPARRLAAAVPGAGARDRLDERRLGRHVLRDDPERLVRRVDGLDGAHDDAAEGVADDVAEPDLGRDLPRERRQLGRVERVARERADEVVADARERRVQRVRALDVRLGEVLLVLRDVDVEARARDDAAALDRVLARLAQRDEGVVLLVVGEVEAGHPARELDRRVAGPLELRHESGQLTPGRRPVHAADAQVDGVHGAPADDVHDRVAGLLQAQRHLDEVAAVARQLDGPVVAEEVGCVQHRGVQDVALDPLAAVDEPAQEPHLLGQLDPADGLHRVAGARDVRDRADPADARRDVGRLRELAPAEQRLEEARRLEDLELHLLDLVAPDAHEHGALALDARQVVGADLPGR